VRVWAQSGEYDLTTADGRKQFRDAMNAAAYESDKISERVKRGKLRRARKGRHHGGARSYAMPGYLPAPEGWERGDVRTLVSEEQLRAERAIVRECYARLLAGEGVSTVVRDLGARGIGGVGGGAFSRSSLAHTLRRPAMAGLLAHNGDIMGELAGGSRSCRWRSGSGCARCWTGASWAARPVMCTCCPGPCGAPVGCG
jgi:site-specific DNA recombinase